MQVRNGRVRCVVIPCPAVREDVEQRWVGGDAVQVELPFVCDGANVVKGFGEFEAAVEEHHRDVRLGAHGEVEDGKGVFASGERDIAVVAGDVMADALDEALECSGVRACRGRAQSKQASEVESGVRWCGHPSTIADSATVV